MKKRRFPLCGVRVLLALWVLIALSLSSCALRNTADPAEEAPVETSAPIVRGTGREFPYLLGTGVLLGMFVAVRLRRKAEHDPTRR